MKKILILLILSAMLLTSFVACKKEDTPDVKPPVSEDSGKDTENIDDTVNIPKLDPPSDEIIEEIKTSWYEQHGETVEWVPERNLFQGIGFYYGTYKGCVIIFCNGVLNWEVTVEIGKESFWNGCDFKIYTYKNGRFDLLEQVYEEGYLTDEDISAIADHHRSIQKSMYPEGLSSSIDESKLISEGWSHWEEETLLYERWHKIIHGAENIKYIKLDGETTGKTTKIYTDKEIINKLLVCLEKSSPRIIFQFDEFGITEYPGVEFYEHYASIMFAFEDNTALRISVCKNGRIIFNSDAVEVKYQFMYYSEPNTVDVSELSKILNY